MYIEDAGTTWAGTHTFRAKRLYIPRSIDEAADVIASHDRVRAVGTRHSFNDIADGDVMISLAGLEPDFRLDDDTATVSFSSATKYATLAAWLEEHGWALQNMGSLPHISVAGASATGTHGSGDTNPVLAEAVAAVSLITADGDILEFDRAHPDFPGIVLSIGALGVIGRITLDIQPSYDLRQDVYHGLPWESLDELDSVMAAGYSVSLFTTWDEPSISRVLVKTKIEPHQQIAADLFGARLLSIGAPELKALGENRTQHGGVPGPWLERLPHFRHDATPSNGDEIQSEYFVSRADGAAAIAGLRELASDIAPHLIATEIRSVAADELWLSMAYRQPSLGIHFTWLNRPDAVASLLPRIEAALAPFRARPHWGKTFTMRGEPVTNLYPRFDDFQALRARLDPTGKFTNDYLQRTLGG